jgi:hypothetical protein
VGKRLNLVHEKPPPISTEVETIGVSSPESTRHAFSEEKTFWISSNEQNSLVYPRVNPVVSSKKNLFKFPPKWKSSKTLQENAPLKPSPKKRPLGSTQKRKQKEFTHK